MKDGQPLSIDGSTYQLTQTVTDRASSTYSNVLTVSETAPTGVAGTYTCNVTNDLGSDSDSFTAVGELLVYKLVLVGQSSHSFLYFNTGITLSGLEQALTVGQSAIITCTINIVVSSIELRDQSPAVLSSTVSGGAHSMLEYTIDLVSADLQGQKYSCTAETEDGTEYTDTVQIEVVGKSVINNKLTYY